MLPFGGVVKKWVRGYFESVTTCNGVNCIILSHYLSLAKK